MNKATIDVALALVRKMVDGLDASTILGGADARLKIEAQVLSALLRAPPGSFGHVLLLEHNAF